MLASTTEALLFCIATPSAHVPLWYLSNGHRLSYWSATSALLSVSLYLLQFTDRLSSASLSFFFEELTSLLEIILTYHSVTIISGDFNIYFDDGDDATARKLLDLCIRSSATCHRSDLRLCTLVDTL